MHANIRALRFFFISNRVNSSFSKPQISVIRFFSSIKSNMSLIDTKRRAENGTDRCDGTMTKRERERHKRQENDGASEMESG